MKFQRKKKAPAAEGPDARAIGSQGAEPISVRRFLLIYVGMMGGFFFLIGYKPIQTIFDLNGVYTDGIVAITSWIISGMNIPLTYEGSLIMLPTITLDISFGCNGLEAVMIYSVAVAAFPATWKKKLVGMLAGFLVIQVINVIRIAALGYTAVKHREAFDFFHIYIAQGMMIAVALGVFFLYLGHAKRV